MRELKWACGVDFRASGPVWWLWGPSDGVCGDGLEYVAMWRNWRYGVYGDGGGEIWVYGDHILIAGPING